MYDLPLDKLCDQVSDAILDAHLKQDPNAKVACGELTFSHIPLLCWSGGKPPNKAVVWKRRLRE